MCSALNSDIDIKYCFLKLILLEHTPLLACFTFGVRSKLLLFRSINFRKQYFYIDIGVKGGVRLFRVLQELAEDWGTKHQL